MMTEMDVILDAVKENAGFGDNGDYDIEANLEGVIISPCRPTSNTG